MVGADASSRFQLRGEIASVLHRETSYILHDTHDIRFLSSGRWGGYWDSISSKAFGWYKVGFVSSTLSSCTTCCTWYSLTESGIPYHLDRKYGHHLVPDINKKNVHYIPVRSGNVRIWSDKITSHRKLASSKTANQQFWNAQDSGCTLCTYWCRILQYIIYTRFPSGKWLGEWRKNETKSIQRETNTTTPEIEE